MNDLGVAFYKAVKNNSRCLVCHTRQNVTFHHVDPATKISEVQKAARNGGLFAVVNELNKCVPLCWPHHSEVHKGIRQGWLRGQFDNGKQSHHLIAQRFMPYLPYMARQQPELFAEFYRENVTQAHDILAPLLYFPDRAA